MSSADELLREREEDGPTQSEPQSSRRARIADTAEKVFSVRYFIMALAVISIGLFGLSFLPIISALPGVGGVGVFLAAFVLGVFGGERRYLETGIAGAIAVGVSILSTVLFVSLVSSSGTRVVAGGAIAGGVVAVLGYYFGRDLRDGLTRDLS